MYLSAQVCDACMWIFEYYNRGDWRATRLRWCTGWFVSTRTARFFADGGNNYVTIYWGNTWREQGCLTWIAGSGRGEGVPIQGNELGEVYCFGVVDLFRRWVYGFASVHVFDNNSALFDSIVKLLIARYLTSSEGTEFYEVTNWKLQHCWWYLQ